MQDGDVNFDPDLAYRIRQRIGPWLTRLAGTLGQPEYRIRPAEYVGTVDMPMTELIAVLRSGGFTWGPFSWYHQPPVETDPNGSWTYRRSLFADRQLHVILTAQAPEHITVYAHEEYNWLRHPIKHGEQVGIDREKGASEVRTWLEDRGLDVHDEGRTRREIARLLHEGRDRLVATVGRR